MSGSSPGEAGTRAQGSCRNVTPIQTSDTFYESIFFKGIMDVRYIGCRNVETAEILEVEIPTPEEAEREAKYLVYKLILCPEHFNILDLARLNQILIAEGYMD